MTDCVFCKIVAGEIPCYKLYEDDDFIAFLDAFPFVRGHTLVIPKKHYRFVWDYPEVGKYFEVVSKIANSMKEKIDDDVVRCSVVGTEVPHAHVHLFPSKKNTLKGRKLEESEMKKILKEFKIS